MQGKKNPPKKGYIYIYIYIYIERERERERESFCVEKLCIYRIGEKMTNLK